jgi:hypothetical protein
MHTSQKLSSRNLATSLFTILVLSFNNLTATLPASSSSHDLHTLDKTIKRGRLQRAVSLSNIKEFSSDSSSSDGETSDGSTSSKSRLSRAGAAITRVFKNSKTKEAKEAARDAGRKLNFFREKWLKATARARATVSVPEISPIIVSSAAPVATPDRSLSATVDLGDTFPSQAWTAKTLSLVCTPLVVADGSRKVPALSPASPIPMTYRSACLEFWFEKTK